MRELSYNEKCLLDEALTAWRFILRKRIGWRLETLQRHIAVVQGEA